MRRGSFGGQGMQALTRGTWPALSRLAIQTSGSGNAPSQLKPVEAEKSNAVDRPALARGKQPRPAPKPFHATRNAGSSLLGLTLTGHRDAAVAHGDRTKHQAEWQQPMNTDTANQEAVFSTAW
eukprot:s3049_g3.t1